MHLFVLGVTELDFVLSLYTILQLVCQMLMFQWSESVSKLLTAHLRFAIDSVCIGVSPNGKATDSDSVTLGSNPGTPAKITTGTYDFSCKCLFCYVVVNHLHTLKFLTPMIWPASSRIADCGPVSGAITSGRLPESAASTTLDTIYKVFGEGRGNPSTAP